MKTIIVANRDRIAAEQWQQIKLLRAQFEEMPITVPVGTFQFDSKSRARLQSVVEACGTEWAEWLDVDNQAIEFSPSDLRQLYYDLVERHGRRILALGAFTREQRQRLPLSQDDQVLRGEGWPS